MYKPLDLKEPPAALEKKIRSYWEENNIEELSVTNKKDHPRFVFFEGPPTANGKPGIHHVLGRTLKDGVCRYKTMQGFQVMRKAGWDTHGLPVEIEVEKKLGLEDKKSIEEYGIAAFCSECRDSVFSYEKEWREMTKTMGYWLDMEHPYITLTNDYIETVWWLLDQMFKKDLLYKSHKIVPYCPSCGTPLSSHEVAQGYKDVEDPSVFVRFKSKDMENTYFLAWTTTPWTLISNVALAVNPTEPYVRVEHEGQYFILAKALLRVLDGTYEIREEFLGKTLEYKEYEPLFTFTEADKKAWFVTLADYVSMEDGTGIVHTAPAFGQDDYALGQKYNLPIIQPVDGAGKFCPEVTPWAGIFVKDADKGIIQNLKERGLLYKRAQIKHSYPFCWRCDSPLLYYARSSWFIKTSIFREQLIANNKTVNWHPPFVGEKRFGEWLENNIDWALSRDRFWGTPLNIWVCPECGKLESIGSIAELREKGRMENGGEVTATLDLHRPHVDKIKLTCGCGAKMQRTPEVIDCWFDSGAMPFAQWHYPFENSENFDKLFPADFISEGIDQTRGWFYSLLAISTIIKGVAPYKNVLVNDLILDKNGLKMSKSRGNTLSPMQLMENYGADSVRWYLLTVSPPWIPTKFDPKGVEEIVGKFFGTLKNTYSFFATYANIDSFDAAEHTSRTATAEIDRWVLSRLNSVLEQVTVYNDNYDFTKSLRLIQNFVVEEVSNWFVRRSRRRFWSMELTDDKIDAYLTLHSVLEKTCRLIAPFAPHTSEKLYLSLMGKSVHLADYPVCEKDKIDPLLEDEMESIITTVSLGRAARNTCQIKVRQTLSRLFVPEKLKATVERMRDLIIEEINIKEICYISEKDGFVNYSLKPDFKVMGPKFGKAMKQISSYLTTVDAKVIVPLLQRGEAINLNIGGENYQITEEDVQITIDSKEGYIFESAKGLYVALDTTLTPELICEGLARELVNKIQFTRKENGFEIMDRISVQLSAANEVEKELQEVVSVFGDYIKSETLAATIELTTAEQTELNSWDVNGRMIAYKIKRV